MSDPVARLNTALEGRYAIERELGEGGMATVYLADDLKHERKVALKVLKPELAAVVGAERFLAEIKTTANLTHPHILPLHDSGEADGFLFYVMPYLEGETLGDRIEREKQLPVDEAVALASKVAGALQHAHEHGVIHRDIRPANILLQGGEPVVADFGIEQPGPTAPRSVVDDERVCAPLMGRVRAELGRSGVMPNLRPNGFDFAVFRFGPLLAVVVLGRMTEADFPNAPYGETLIFDGQTQAWLGSII